MSTRLEKIKLKALEIERVVNATYTTLSAIGKKKAAGDELTESESKQYDVLSDIVKKTISGEDEVEKKLIDEALPLMNTTALSKLSTAIQVVDGWTNLLAYHSNGINNGDLIVDTSIQTARPTYVAGEDRKYLSLPDDVLGYADRPTLNIVGRGSLFTSVHNSVHGKIDGSAAEMFLRNNTYVINLNFRLKRFPSKVVDFGNGNRKAVGTRRTEIAKFDYGTWIQNTTGGTRMRERSVSIGAVAPFAQEVWTAVNDENGSTRKRESRKYVGRKDPFSIGICVPDATGFLQTVYTDYKFKLNTWYSVKIKFDYLDPGDGEPMVYVSVKVNNVDESLAITRGKLWSKNKNKWRRKYGTIKNEKGEVSSFGVASQPGFLVAAGFGDSDKSGGINSPMRVQNDMQQLIGKNRRSDGSWTYTFDELNRVITPPYDAPITTSGQLISGNNQVMSEVLMRPKRAWNNRKHLTNTAIDYGDIFVDMLRVMQYAPKQPKQA